MPDTLQSVYFQSKECLLSMRFQIYLSRFALISTLKKVSKKILSVPTILPTVQRLSFIGENFSHIKFNFNPTIF